MVPSGLPTVSAVVTNSKTIKVKSSHPMKTEVESLRTPHQAAGEREVPLREEKGVAEQPTSRGSGTGKWRLPPKSDLAGPDAGAAPPIWWLTLVLCSRPQAPEHSTVASGLSPVGR